MLVYLADKSQFLLDNEHGDIDERVHRAYQKHTGRKVAKAELQSWQNSLGRMAAVLRDVGIPDDTGVAVEFHIPRSAKRIDIMLSGYGPKHTKNLVLLELKQWESARATSKDAVVMTRLAGGERETVHPSYQAWSYAALLEGFNEAVYDGGISVQPCAYLHNYTERGGVTDERYAEHIAKAPLFLKGEADTKRLREFVKRHIRKGDDRQILYELAGGRIRPSKALADSLVGLLKGKREFVLIDEQKMAYEGAIVAAETASSSQPRVVIVEGGPGTGKSVVAINLLAELTSRKLVCKYVSKNSAPRAVYEAKLTGTMRRTQFSNLFSGSGSFVDVREDEFDVLIVDEAHRLNARSGLYRNLGENQIQELIASAKCTIFFLDEDQRIALHDIGSRDAIEGFAVEKGASVESYVLPSQFRCGGSDGYLAWLDNTLGIRETANLSLQPGEFDFRVFSTPSELHDAIEARNGENKARVVAGYCWEWKSKRSPRAYDIQIGSDYRKRWNLGSDGSLWIVAPESVNEVGCIHTCQGLELDYVGVIIGPDLVVRDGEVRTNPRARARHDATLFGYRNWERKEPEKAMRAADTLIKNTYRTLMSRGMKGCYVYCTDDETRSWFERASGPTGLE